MAVKSEAGKSAGVNDSLTVAEPAAGALAAHKQLTERARKYVDSAKSPETLRGYRVDWEHFSRWCRERGIESLPATPETVALYLTDGAETGYHPSTLQRRLSSLSQAHAAAGYTESPTKSALVRAVWQGIRREKGIAKQGKAPALSADLIRMVAALPDTTLGIRDRALLLVGFAGAFRRSELIALDISDVAFVDQGATITIRRSKTDQEGKGQKVGIPYGISEDTCPVRALAAWMAILETCNSQNPGTDSVLSGPLLRGVDRHGNVSERRLCGRTVARVVQRAIARTGKDASRFAGHSLRSGLATSAAMAGKSMNSIMGQTRHRSEAMVRVYIREGSLFRDNAAQGIGI